MFSVQRIRAFGTGNLISVHITTSRSDISALRVFSQWSRASVFAPKKSQIDRKLYYTRRCVYVFFSYIFSIVSVSAFSFSGRGSSVSHSCRIFDLRCARSGTQQVLAPRQVINWVLLLRNCCSSAEDEDDDPDVKAQREKERRQANNARER